MSIVKKVPPEPATAISYEIAAALHRAKMVAAHVPHPNDFVPIDGVLHVTLNTKPIKPGTEAEVFGPSRIDIPELRQLLKK
ncbi:MAG: hypothetical protein ABW202_06250 [Duganella sp.]